MERCGQTKTGELWNVTGLCSVLYAHGGSKLRLVLIMHQPHLRNPFQIVCGVDLRTHTMKMRHENKMEPHLDLV